MKISRPTLWIWIAAVFIALLSGVIFLAIAGLPYTNLKSLVDSLATDGQVESFTLGRYQQLRPLAAVLGMALLLAGGAALLRPRKSQQLLGKALAWLGAIIRRLGRDCLILFQDLRGYFSDRLFTIALAAITLAGAAVRYTFLALPVRYDEAYTFVVFAMRPLQFILSDYHVPNNHIFHTLLVRGAYLLFGAELWSLRLPVFIAGVLLIPLVYLAGRIFFERHTALLAAALTAGSSILIEYSANGRGYMLICLFSILLLILAAYLKSRPNLAAWALFVITAALGFYTVPIFLYPFGMVAGWLITSILLGDATGKRWPVMRSLIIACALAACLTLLLYLPVIQNAGFAALTGNRFVSSVDQAIFIESILGRARTSWSEWQRDLPGITGAAMLLGLGIATIFNHRLSTQRVPFLLPAAAWILLILAIQQVTPWPRVWLFLLPFVLIWTAGGLVGLARLLMPRREAHSTDSSRSRLPAWLYAGAIFCLAVVLSLRVYQVQVPLQNSQHNEQALAEFLKGFLEPGDVVAAAIPVNYPLRYYFVLNQIPLDVFFDKAKDIQFQRAVVVVDRGQGQTLEQVLTLTRLDEALEPLDTPQPVHQERSARVYVFQP